MSTITTTMSPIPLLKHRNTVVTLADQNEFVTKYEATNNHLSNNTVVEVNAICDEIDIVASEINVMNSETNANKNDTLDYKNTALVYRDEAIQAKQAIDSYVVPTSATYTFEQTDALLADKSDKLDTYTKDAINTFLEDKADKDTTYTKDEVNDMTGNNPLAYLLGQPGELGFGVATATAEQYMSVGCIPLNGHNIIGDDNYGNYMHASSGAILCWIPKHYFKITGNTFEYSDTPTTGYVIDRSFINGGVEISGVMVAKYPMTNNNGIVSAQAGQDPMSTDSAHNPISQLNGTPSNTFGGLYQAVKTMDALAVLTPNWVYSMLFYMAKAHGEASITTNECAYIDVDPKMPKGNLNSALSDVDDTSVTFEASGYENCALTGSGRPFAKTTHNGQNCGIADLNGNMRETASGFIRTDAQGFLILKESVDIRDILTDDITQGGGGAYDIDLYDVVDISDVVSANDGWTYLGNATNQVFAFSTDRTNISYKRTALGIPTLTGHSVSGTTEFGNDGVYRYLRNEMACLRGGNWSYVGHAGLGAMILSHYRTSSAYTVVGRASLIVA